jgi:hypothetical protein
VSSGLNISVQWSTALFRESGEPHYFPNKFTPYFRQAYSVPAVYRRRVIRRQPGEKETIYVGEAEDLTRRIQRVLTPSGTAKDTDTNKRLHQIFRKCLAENQTVVIDIAKIEPFEINGVQFDQQGIADRFKRRALENLLLVFEQARDEFQLLNMVVDYLGKAREALLKSWKPHEVDAVFKHFGLNKES